MDELEQALRETHPELESVRAAARQPVYLVGGAVRDLLLGRQRADIDLMVEGDATDLAAELGGANSEHDRFGTVKVDVDGHEVDIVGARTESYERPGALPTVTPAESIEEDLARRDFTINAMAIPLQGEPRLIDPYGGRRDLEQGLLRVLHDRSFVDDPTRAIRAARYASRFGFQLTPETEELLRQTDLTTVSADRRRAELERLAAEETACAGFELIGEWGLIDLRPGGIELMRAVDSLLRTPHWAEAVPRERSLVAAALGPPGAEEVLASMWMPKPGEGVEVAERRDPVELILARAMGADWLDNYLTAWRRIELEIDGDDLIAAGVEQGPAIGRGLRAARHKKLEGEIHSREEELATALAAALRD
ncbi:MAG: CCA tRNA nucleotidyltransferase [Solirubrobacterales bacterium]